MYQCPCCNEYTLEEEGKNTLEICLNCGWQMEDVWEQRGGANLLTIEEARWLWNKERKLLTRERELKFLESREAA